MKKFKEGMNMYDNVGSIMRSWLTVRSRRKVGRLYYCSNIWIRYRKIIMCSKGSSHPGQRTIRPSSIFCDNVGINWRTRIRG